MLLYFDCDSSRTFIHALRRHWLTSITWIILHWPFSAGLILMSASFPAMVRDAAVEEGAFEGGESQADVPKANIDDRAGLRWYFAGGTGVAVLCTALIGWTHLSLDAPHKSMLPRVRAWLVLCHRRISDKSSQRLRLSLRVLVAAFFACMPLFSPETDLAILGITAGVLMALLIVETIGKIGAESIDQIDIVNPPPGKGGRYGRWGHGIKKEDLLDSEKGEEDVGIEEGLAHVEIRSIQPHQRLAYTS